jgi:predicted PurR-regulated permease PerM
LSSEKLADSRQERRYAGRTRAPGAPTYSAYYSRVFFTVSLAILGYVVLQVLRPLAGPLCWAAVLAFVLHPLHERLTRRFRGRSGLSAGVLTALTPFCVIAPLTVVAFAFARQVSVIIDWMHGRTLLPYPQVLDNLEGYPVVGGAVHWLRLNATVSAEQLQAWITDGAQALLKSVASFGGTFALGVVGSLFGFFMMLFVLFFLLRDGRPMLEQLTRLIPMEPGRRAKLLNYLGDVTLAVVYGSVATALIQGTLAGVGFAIVRLPSPVVFGVLATIAAFLPVGSAIVLVPAVLYLMFTGHWGGAIFLGIWSACVGILDNLLRPYLTARRVEVSTLAVFVGAIGGAATFGVLGLVLGPVLLGFVSALGKFIEDGSRLDVPARE